MKRHSYLLLLFLLLPACGGPGSFDTDYARGYYQVSHEQCVPYAREQSGIEIYGNAHTWWPQAASGYYRGHYPLPGAVMVLAKSEKLRNGHLAVVKRIVDPRTIEVSHTNWGSGPLSRRIVYEKMRVEDISRMNDWSLVHFWNHEEQCFGFPYPVQGFIYKG